VFYYKNKYKIFFLLLIILIFGCIAEAQTKIITNIEVLETCYKNISKNIVKDMRSDNKFVLLSVESDSNSFLFEQIFRNELILNGFVIISYSDSLFSKINVYLETKIRYERIKGNENFIRDVFVSSVVSLGSDERGKLYKSNYCDTLSKGVINYIDNKKIRVYSESLNEMSFWNSLFKPVIILASAGLMVYLLFTVRSK